MVDNQEQKGYTTYMEEIEYGLIQRLTEDGLTLHHDTFYNNGATSDSELEIQVSEGRFGLTEFSVRVRSDHEADWVLVYQGFDEAVARGIAQTMA